MKGLLGIVLVIPYLLYAVLVGLYKVGIDVMDRIREDFTK